MLEKTIVSAIQGDCGKSYFLNGGNPVNTTAKEFLSQAYRIDRRIHSKLAQVQSLRDLATKTGATLSDIPRSLSPNGHRMEEFICKAVDLQHEINHDLCHLIDTKQEIVTTIKLVENVELQTLLELRYLCLKSIL
jgi:hypothetical protein